MPESITRRNLPHWYRPGAAHFVTYRLAGSLPAEAVARLRDELRTGLRPLRGPRHRDRRARLHKRAFAAYDRMLHESPRVRHLADPRVARLALNSLRHHDGGLLTLLAACVMPNHVHAVFVPVEPDPAGGERPHDLESSAAGPLATIMQSLKGYTAREANKILGRTGPFWQAESYDHWVRDDEELLRVVEYVVRNPVTAGLAERSEDWPWTWCDRERLL